MKKFGVDKKAAGADVREPPVKKTKEEKKKEVEDAKKTSG